MTAESKGPDYTKETLTLFRILHEQGVYELSDNPSDIKAKVLCILKQALTVNSPTMHNDIVDKIHQKISIETLAVLQKTIFQLGRKL